MSQWLSPKQVAESIGVSESSLKRWCDRGVLPFSRTPGGHRRVPLDGVISYLREQKLDPTRPEILGLPNRSQVIYSHPAEALPGLMNKMSSGDFEGSRTILVDLFMKGVTIADLGDQLLTPVLAQIGEQWADGDTEIYEERRAVGVATRVLHELSRLLPRPQEGARMAIGGTIEGDQYSVATFLVELTLRELGWSANSLGSNLPFPTMLQAAQDVNPRLFWLSISQIEDVDRFVDALNQFQSDLAPSIALVIGGRCVNDDLRKRTRFSACCDDLQQLARYVTSIYS